jgi:hypothetical protein
MKKYDTRFISQVRIADGIKLITSRSIEEEMTDLYDRVARHRPELKSDLRHLGRCQRVNIIDYNGDDYTQDVGPEAGELPVQPKNLSAPHVFTDLQHAPDIKLVDLTRFDRKPGSSITIIPKHPIRFVNVTVRICDLFNRELVYDHAWDEDDIQEWTFTYFPQHRFSPDPGNLHITIWASEKPRLRKEAMVDLYELPPEKLREKVLCLN